MSETAKRKYVTIRHFPERGAHEAQIRVPGHEQITHTCYQLWKLEEFIATTLPPLVATMAMAKAAAKAKAEEEAKALLKPEPVQGTPAEGPQTLAELLPEPFETTIKAFMDSDQAGKRHAQVCPTVLNNLEGARLCDLTRAWTKDYIARMRKAKTLIGNFFSYGSIAQQIQIMRMIVRWRSEQLNLPIVRTGLSTKLLPKGWDRHRDRLLEEGEEERIRAVIEARPGLAGPQWGHLLTLALETAARQQELLLSEWRDFDLKCRVWSIPQHHTKTRAPRVIPLSLRATAAVLALKEMALPGPHTRPFHALGSPASVSALWRRHTREAGVLDLRFHDLRHCAITNFVLNKPKLRDVTIMKITGHTELKSFMRYANLRMGDIVSDMD